MSPREGGSVRLRELQSMGKEEQLFKCIIHWEWCRMKNIQLR